MLLSISQDGEDSGVDSEDEDERRELLAHTLWKDIADGSNEQHESDKNSAQDSATEFIIVAYNMGYPSDEAREENRSKDLPLYSYNEGDYASFEDFLAATPMFEPSETNTPDWYAEEAAGTSRDTRNVEEPKPVRITPHMPKSPLPQQRTFALLSSTQPMCRYHQGPIASSFNGFNRRRTQPDT